MKPPFEDIENRRPVWYVLSWLFLDTELEPQQHREMATVLNQSPYTPGEIERILFEEVYPACIINMSVGAGEWEGFDPDWLEERIRANGRRPWKKWHILQWKRWLIHRHWRFVHAMLTHEKP